MRAAIDTRIRESDAGKRAKQCLRLLTPLIIEFRFGRGVKCGDCLETIGLAVVIW